MGSLKEVLTEDVMKMYEVSQVYQISWIRKRPSNYQAPLSSFVFLRAQVMLQIDGMCVGGFHRHQVASMELPHNP